MEKLRRWMAFDGARGPDGKVRSRVWDRVCVPGYDEKDGQKTEFTLETLSQMVDNFVQRGDVIPLDYNHQSNYAHINGAPAPALAFYGALAVVWGGKIAKLGCAEGVTATGLEDGLDLTKDGLWAFRSEVTELGDQLLPNFKLTSPTFTPEGTLRDGTAVGYSLAAVAATNTPWQGGTSITFEGERVDMRVEQRGSEWVVLPESGDKVLGTHKTKEGAEAQLRAIEASKHTHQKGAATMAKAKFAKFAGAADGADDAAIKSALSAKTAELAKAAMEDEAFKYDEAAKELEDMAAEMDGEEGFEGEAASMSKMAQKFRRMAKFDEMGGGNSEGPKAGLTPGDPAKSPPMTDVSKSAAKMESEEDDTEKAKMAAMQATLDSLKAKVAKFERTEADREAAAQKERETQFSQLAKDAQAGGWKGDAKALIAFARSDFDAARKLVESFLPAARPQHLMSRMTHQGAPLGGEGSNARTAYGPAKPRSQRTPFGTFVEDDGEFADEIKSLAQSKDPILMAKVDRLITGADKSQMFNRLLAAEKVVRAERPELAEAAE